MGLRHVAQDDRHACDYGILLVGNGHNVETEKTLLRIKDFQFLAEHFSPLVLVRGPDLLPVNITEIIRERFADGPLGTNAQQLARSGIEIRDSSFSVGNDDAFLDRIKERFKKTFLAGQLEHDALQTLRVNPLDAADQLIKKGCLHWN